MNWTTPEDIRQRVQREWEKGRLLAAIAAGEPLFPLRIPLKGPSSTELRDQFTEVQEWIARLRAAASGGGRPGFRLEMRRIEHRVIGGNDIPAASWIDSLDEALALIGKGREARRYQELLAMTRERCPSVLPWLAKRPLHAVDLAGDWSRLLAVVNWLQANPRPGVYLRQVDLPGVHTKFIEAHKGVLAELFDLALPAEAIHSEAKGAGLFERRYGFREKPATVRLRLLDAAPALPRGLSDLALIDGEFARFDPGVSRVFITENEINFLAFPQAPDSLVIFGAGYGFDPLRQAGWLHDKAIYYWGDIDTHGFAILDQLRAHFPEARSLLMDRDTLMAHREYWVTETRPTDRNLSRLTPAETALYDDLRSSRLGDAVRLEQEKIGFQRLLAAVI